MLNLLATAVVLRYLAQASGEPVLQFNACSAQCNHGFQTAVTKMCTSALDNSWSYPCETTMVDCNTQPCTSPWKTAWSDCSASCGGGTRQRSSTSGSVESIPCNAISCSLSLPPGCPADVIFAIDSSASIGYESFDIFKQMAMDIEKSLPVSESGMRIGYVKYSGTAEAVFSLTNSYDQSEISANIWASNFTGGTGCSANGLAAVRDMFNASTMTNYPRVVVFFTDGPDSLAAAKANTIAMEMKQNVHMYVVQLGVDQNIFLFADEAQYVFPANKQHTPSKIANTILVRLGCVEMSSVVEVEVDNSLGDILMVAMQAETKEKQQCSEWSDYGPCSESCGETGVKRRSQWCVTFGANQENITEFKYITCRIPCPTELPPIPSGPYPDCRRCNYTKGQVWFPDPDNCHLYYICDKIDRLDGTWYFRVYHPTCGELFWDQDRLTCVRTVPINANCTVGDVVPYEAPTTTFAPCPYKTLTDQRYFQSKDNPMDIYECLEGFIFLDSDEPCTCVPVDPINPTCDNRLLLYFQFDVNFDDATCHNAKGYLHGEDDGEVELVYDSVRQEMVAQFDGKSRIEVPFMRNWLQDQNQQAWTVAAWVKRQPGPYNCVGIVDNGDCEDSASFHIHSNVDNGNPTACGGIAASNGFPATSTGSFKIDYDSWVHLAVVYDGNEVRIYEMAELRKSIPLSGAMLNTQNPLYIGMQGCCNKKPGYFKGRIDDVRVYTVALTEAEIHDIL